MIKTVLDTNVLVSSFFGGNPRRIIDLWRRGEITLCLTRAIFNEYIEVLRRMKMEDDPGLEELLDLFARGDYLLFSAKTPKLHLVKEHPDDDKFIECAVALKAKYIVTGDKALASVGEYMAIQIVSPKKFLELVK